MVKKRTGGYITYLFVASKKGIIRFATVTFTNCHIFGPHPFSRKGVQKSIRGVREGERSHFER